jgi:hypothetical protein
MHSAKDEVRHRLTGTSTRGERREFRIVAHA